MTKEELAKKKREGIYRLQEAYRAAGLCCTGCRRKLSTQWYCSPCQAKRSAANRRRLGFQPHKPGGRGRPPKHYLPQPTTVTKPEPESDV